MNDIDIAQVEAGENSEGPTGCLDDNDELSRALWTLSSDTVDRILRESLPNVAQRELEHSLATGFIKLQKERNPAARQAQWVELQRLAREIEKEMNS